MANSVGTECTGSPFRMLFGPRAATRLNGPSVHHGAARYLRNVMCAPLKGRKSENGRDGVAKRSLERRDRGRDRDARATQRNDKTSTRRSSTKNIEKEKERLHAYTHAGRTPWSRDHVYKAQRVGQTEVRSTKKLPKSLCLFFFNIAIFFRSYCPPS